MQGEGGGVFMHAHTTIPILPVPLAFNLEVTSVQVFVPDPLALCLVYLHSTVDQST